MRFDRLDLAAFGPFTGRELCLDEGQFGVHVLYGPNEAGKSSALRAVRALLFGVPERTGDTFLHDTRTLRVGAVIRLADGGLLTCYRRKGRKDTLLDAAGDPLDERVLAALLQGTDEERFRRLFGIDHDDLVAGGRWLLEERGREAEILFGSALGSARVHSVLSALDQEAQALFAPRGQKPAINALLREMEAVRGEVKEATLPVSRWEEVRKASESARVRRDEAELALAAAQSRIVELERLRRTLPGLARLRQYEADLAGLGAALALAPDFATRRRDAVDRQRSGQEALQRAAKRLADGERDMQGMEVDEALLDEARAIDDLHARLGEQRRARLERPGLEAREQHATRALTRSLEMLGGAAGNAAPDRAELAARLAHRGRAETLSRQHDVRTDRVRDLEQRLDERRREQARCERELAALPVPVATGELSDAIKVARSLGDVDEQVARLSGQRASAVRACRDALAALGRFAGDADALLAVALPGPATVRDHQSRFRELADEARRLRDARRACEQRMDEASRALQALEGDGPVPSPEELAAARARRGQGWTLVRERWLEDAQAASGVAGFTGDGSDDEALARAFELAVDAADGVADRLRRDARAVQERASLFAAIDRCRGEIATHERDQRRVEDEHAAAQATWRALWSEAGVEAGTPEDMAGWLQSVEQLRDQLRTLGRLRDEHEQLAGRREAARVRLEAACHAVAGGTSGAAGDGADPDARAQAATGTRPPADAELGPVLTRAESLVATLDAQAQRRRSVEERAAGVQVELENDEGQLARSRAELDAWRSSWDALCADLGLERERPPGELSAYFDLLQTAIEHVDERDTLRGQLGELDREIRAFEAEVDSLCGRVAPSLAALSAEDRVIRMHALLREQRETGTRLAELRRQAGLDRKERDDAEARVQAAAGELEALCREAGGVTLEMLEEVERTDRDHRELTQKRETARDELLAQGDGLSLEALSSEAAGVDFDAAKSELERRRRAIDDELDPEYKRSAKACFDAERDFEELAAGAGAAALEARARQIVAEIRDEAARYMRVRVASHVLREQIDRFRRTHRDPILAAAGDYFRRLTDGGFVSVVTEFDTSDQPVLSAVRDGAEQLHVDALSTGTRDQLYLALRLAALDHYLETAEPLPFIVDDVLVQFDDARTRATLKTLAHFSRRTQVLLFTHHARVAEDAAALASEGGGVFVHSLE